jgi:hypothetical protein
LSRAIAESAAELAKQPNLSSSQEHLAQIAEGIFADLVTSVYLASIGLAEAAQMVDRRALELGLAVVYLWDLPHTYWGWSKCDTDLSFGEMLDHLSGLSYRTYLKETINFGTSDQLVDSAAAKRIYRSASNTIHGKIRTQLDLATEGFNHSSSQWRAHIALTQEIADLLLSLWFRRFPQIGPAVRAALPAYERLS